MRDELDDLMIECRVKAKREIVQEKLETEAAERAARKAKFEALHSAFDAERFRWLAAHPEWLAVALGKAPKWDLKEWRTRIDLAIRLEHKQCELRSRSQ